MVNKLFPTSGSDPDNYSTDGSLIPGLYIHIPFCIKRCNYCGLSSTGSRTDEIENYIPALIHEIRSRCKGHTFKTLFVGGGTPSLLTPSMIKSIMEAILDVASFEVGFEASIEVNPESVTHLFVQSLVEAGFNRVSIGAQSLVEDECPLLGRLHTPEDVYQSFKLFRKAGLTNLSLDLIAAWPGHSLKTWKKSLERALHLDPSHISLYLYHREDNTVFDKLLTKGDIQNMPEDEQVDIYNYTLEYMESHSYSQYEISNFAKEGHTCIHNLNYWYDRSYIGVGAGAASFVDGVRFTNLGDPLLYCRAVQNGESLVDYSERLDREAYWREAVVLRLRMTEFFSLLSINPLPLAKVVADVRAKLLHCAEAGLVNVRSNDEFCLSKKGLLLANEVMSRVV